MSERNFWKVLQKNLKKHGAVTTRIENPIGPGTPDVYLTYKAKMVWLELKYIEKWPKKGPLKIPHFSKEQRLWIKLHGRVGAKVYVFARIQKDYLLFRWDAALLIGTLPKKELIKEAWAHWYQRINYRELLCVL